MDALEHRILALLAGAAVAGLMDGESDEGSWDEVSMLLPDTFQRLLAHGIAQFHGLSSFSRPATVAECTEGGGEGSSPPDSEGCSTSAEEGDRIFVVRQSRSPVRPMFGIVKTVVDGPIVNILEGVNFGIE